jgi:glycerophosphoryl diester phosphodiesterase
MTAPPRRLRRVGHKGADRIVPGNTRESFESALAHRVDEIEFDVLRMADGRLVLAHDAGDARKRRPLTLEEGLDLFAGEAYADIELICDLKLPGYEREVVEGLRERDLLGRTLVSTTYRESLPVLGELASGELRRGWSVPRARKDYTKSWLAPGVYLLLLAWRRDLPRQASRLIRSGGCEAVMAHRLLASRRLAGAVHAAGGAVYVWTVDDAGEIARIEAMGVDGVITNDPRLFGPGPA